MPVLGEVWLVRYNVGGRVIYHERLVVGDAPQHPDTFAIITPDFDEYEEDLVVSADVQDVVLAPGFGDRPARIGRAQVYGFGPLPTAGEIERWIRAAAPRLGCPLPSVPTQILVAGGAPIVVPALAAVVPIGPAVPAPPGMVPLPGPPAPAPAPGVVGVVAPPGAAANPAPAAGPRLAGPGGAWVLDEPLVGHNVGEEIAVQAGALMLGTRALVMVDGEEAVVKYLAAGANLDFYAHERAQFLNTDVRVLPTPFTPDTATVPSLVADMVEKPYVAKSPIEGERSAPWFVVKATAATGGSFTNRHQRWIVSSKVKPSLPMVYEHETIATTLDLACTHDRLNIKNHIWTEYLLRRNQLIENSIAESPDNPSFEGARHFMGYGEERGGALVSPGLRSHVASEWGREAAILKEKRKAREAKDAAKGNGRGGGKKNDHPPDKG